MWGSCLLIKEFDHFSSTSWGLDFKFFPQRKERVRRTGQLTDHTEASVAVCWTVLEIV